MAGLVLVMQVVSTVAMFGVIWFVQVVHYPLFARVGAERFAAYSAAHGNRTTVVVAPLMLAELGSGAALLFAGLRSPVVQPTEAWFGMALIGVIWASTALVQVPLHDRLRAQYTETEARRLVATNWIRTVAWSLRAALVVLWVGRLSMQR